MTILFCSIRMTVSSPSKIDNRAALLPKKSRFVKPNARRFQKVETMLQEKENEELNAEKEINSTEANISAMDPSMETGNFFFFFQTIFKQIFLAIVILLVYSSVKSCIDRFYDCIIFFDYLCFFLSLSRSLSQSTRMTTISMKTRNPTLRKCQLDRCWDIRATTVTTTKWNTTEKTIKYLYIF